MLNRKILEKIEQINIIEKKYGNTIYKSATDEEKECFINWFKNQFNNKENLVDYLSFISLVNGMDFNGLVIYSINQSDENNNIYINHSIFWENEEQKKYLFICDDSISWYCFNSNNEKYYVLDKPSGMVIDEYESFNDLILKAMESVL